MGAAEDESGGSGGVVAVVVFKSGGDVVVGMAFRSGVASSRDLIGVSNAGANGLVISPNGVADAKVGVGG